MAVVVGLAVAVVLPLWLEGAGSFVSGVVHAFSRRPTAREVRQSLPAPTHDGPIATSDQLHGKGRIYLVQLGPHDAPYSVDDFAAWLKSKYAIDVQVLPPAKLADSAWYAPRKQYMGELLCEQLRREHPELAADPDAYIIAFTDADMFAARFPWDYNRAYREQGRYGVISSLHLHDAPDSGSSKLANERLRQRVRRLLLRTVALLYWQLPVNGNPNSLMQSSYEPDLPVDDIYVSDLNPERTEWGRDAATPCLFLRYSHTDGLSPLPGNIIRDCDDREKLPIDESQEFFRLDLELGLLEDRHTDFYLPDTIPIQFERVTRDGWTGPMGFGMSGSHNYDQFLQSQDDMATIEVMRNDASRYRLKRMPRAMPFLSLVKFVDTNHSENFLELRWHTSPFEHFELKRYDGQVETFLPCDNKVICYETGLRNAGGQELVFQRDEHRRLIRLTSPGKQWISLTYGPNNAIAKIDDSRGRKIEYGYDEHTRLVKVSYPSGEIHFYEYDDTQHLLTFSVASDPNSAPRVLLRNTYKHGRLATETLADGSVYTFSYDPPVGDIQNAFVNTPDGRIFQVEMCDGCSVIRERTPSSGAAGPRTASPKTAETRASR